MLLSILVTPPQFVLKNVGRLMSLADYSNQYVAVLINSCTDLMADKRVWLIVWWWINENSLEYALSVFSSSYSVFLKS